MTIIILITNNPARVMIIPNLKFWHSVKEQQVYILTSALQSIIPSHKTSSIFISLLHKSREVCIELQPVKFFFCNKSKFKHLYWLGLIDSIWHWD